MGKRPGVKVPRTLLLPYYYNTCIPCMHTHLVTKLIKEEKHSCVDKCSK